MKNIWIVAVALLLAACSTHRIRCRGTLQAINEPAVANQSKDASTEARP